MNNKLVSVIIPVYNGENYIKQCVNSVLNQTYDNVEIIVINDGSTDSTLIILESLNSNEKLNVYSINNSGVSVARNTGIQFSSGDYIFFLDADDSITDNCIENLINTCELLQADYVKCAVYLENNVYNNRAIPINDKLLVDYYQNKSFQFGVIWGILIKRDLILKYNLQFENYKYGEDTLFFANLISLCEKGYFLNSGLYKYNVDNCNSATKNLKYTIENFQKLYDVNLMILEKIVKLPQLTKLIKLKIIVMCLQWYYYLEERNSIIKTINHTLFKFRDTIPCMAKVDILKLIIYIVSKKAYLTIYKINNCRRNKC